MKGIFYRLPFYWQEEVVNSFISNILPCHTLCIPCPLLPGAGYHTACRMRPIWPGPLHKKELVLLQQVQRRVTRLLRGLKHLSCVDRLRELGLFRLEERSLLIVACQNLKGDNKQKSNFSQSNRTRGDGFNLKEDRFRLDISS